MSSNGDLNGSDPDSDMDQEFLNAMNGDDSQDVDNDEVAEPEEGLDIQGENKKNELKVKTKTVVFSNFLEIFGEDILIRVCSTLSASHLCEFAKTSRW